MNSKSTSAVISISHSSLELKDDKNPLDIPEDCSSLKLEKGNGGDVCKVPAAEEECSDQQMNLSEDLGGEQAVTEHLSLISSGELAKQLQGEYADSSLRLLKVGWAMVFTYCFMNVIF